MASRAVGDPEKFIYTDARKDASAAPCFSAGNTITATSVQSTAAYFSIPQAGGPDQVQHYRLEAWSSAGELAAKSYSLADNFYFPAPAAVRGKLTGLSPDTDYTVKCYAVSCCTIQGTVPCLFDAWKGSAPCIHLYDLRESQKAIPCFDLIYAEPLRAPLQARRSSPTAARRIKRASAAVILPS